MSEDEFRRRLDAIEFARKQDANETTRRLTSIERSICRLERIIDGDGDSDGLKPLLLLTVERSIRTEAIVWKMLWVTLSILGTMILALAAELWRLR